MVFPATKGSSDNPSVMKLLDLDSWQSICIPGIYKAYVLHEDNEIGYRIGYGWDNGSTPTRCSFNREKKEVIALPSQRPAFDEESGQLVYFDKSDVIVVDFLY